MHFLIKNKGRNWDSKILGTKSTWQFLTAFLNQHWTQCSQRNTHKWVIGANSAKFRSDHLMTRLHWLDGNRSPFWVFGLAWPQWTHEMIDRSSMGASLRLSFVHTFDPTFHSHKRAWPITMQKLHHSCFWSSLFCSQVQHFVQSIMQPSGGVSGQPSSAAVCLWSLVV